MQRTKALRAIAEQGAAALTLPTRLAYWVQTGLLSEQQAFLAMSQRASLWPGMVGIVLRRALYRNYLAAMGENVVIGMGTALTKPSIKLGDAVYIGSYCLIGDTTIGDNTMISDQVSIISGNHGMAPDRLLNEQPEHYRTVMIGADCWLGGRAVVMADVADHAIVGAGSVVTKPVAEYMIVAGNPARPIGDRRQKGPISPIGNHQQQVLNLRQPVVSVPIPGDAQRRQESGEAVAAW